MSSPTDAAFATLDLEGDGPVRRLWLNRPERLNALSNATLTDLAQAAAWFDRQRDVKVVIVRGRGRAFSAGFDLGDFAAPSGRPSSTREGDDGVVHPDRPARDAADLGRQMADAVAGMRPLTIAAVHGHCVGGGLVLGRGVRPARRRRRRPFLHPRGRPRHPVGLGRHPPPRA